MYAEELEDFAAASDHAALDEWVFDRAIEVLDGNITEEEAAAVLPEGGGGRDVHEEYLAKVRACQNLHVNTCVSILACQCLHVNTCMSILGKDECMSLPISILIPKSMLRSTMTLILY